MRLAQRGGAPASERAWPGVIFMRTVGRAQKTLLIVDEHARLRSAIAAILREAGYAVLEAASGAEGLRLAERYAPQGVLVDLATPGRSGLEVLEVAGLIFAQHRALRNRTPPPATGRPGPPCVRRRRRSQSCPPGRWRPSRENNARQGRPRRAE